MSQHGNLNGPAEQPGRGSQPAELDAFVAGLARLVPRSGRLDRDQLMFGAGRAAAEADRARRAWLRSPAWPAVSVALAATLLVIVAANPEPAVVERVVYLPAESRPAAAPAESGQEIRGAEHLAGPEAAASKAADPGIHPPPLPAAAETVQLAEIEPATPRGPSRIGLWPHQLAEIQHDMWRQPSGPPGRAAADDGLVLSPLSLNDLLDAPAPGSS